MTDNTRDDKGRFAKGNPGGPGRPKKQTEAAYMLASMQACTLADWREIVEKAVSDAKDGDDKARNFLLKLFLSNVPSMTQIQIALLRGHDPLREEYTEAKRTAMMLGRYDRLGESLVSDDEWIEAQANADRLMSAATEE